MLLGQLAAILSEEVSVYLNPEHDVLGAGKLDRLGGRHLVRAAQRLRAVQITLDELYVEFLGTTIYCLTTRKPGTIAYDSAGRRTVPVFTPC
jgi:hypothetical protein